MGCSCSTEDFETWQQSTWWEFGSLDDITQYVARRIQSHETPQEGAVAVALEVNTMPKDLLVQLVVHVASKESSDD